MALPDNSPSYFPSELLADLSELAHRLTFESGEWKLFSHPVYIIGSDSDYDEQDNPPSITQATTAERQITVYYCDGEEIPAYEIDSISYLAEEVISTTRRWLSFVGFDRSGNALPGWNWSNDQDLPVDWVLVYKALDTLLKQRLLDTLADL